MEILYDDDTYFCNNVSLTALSVAIYVLFWLFRSLTRCFSTHAKHVVAKEKDAGTSCGEEPEAEVTDEEIIYRYLYKNYWFTKYPEKNPRKRSKISEKDFRPALRHYNIDRDIQIIYSRQTVWRLAFSEKLELGANEKFAYIFKGLKSWSTEETQGRFANITDDLLKFRQVNIFVGNLDFLSRVSHDLWSMRMLCCVSFKIIQKNIQYIFECSFFLLHNKNRSQALIISSMNMAYIHEKSRKFKSQNNLLYSYRKSIVFFIRTQKNYLSVDWIILSQHRINFFFQTYPPSENMPLT